MSAEEIKKGCNCELYAVGVTRALGYFLPDCFRAAELATDTNHTECIDYYQRNVQSGDIIGFSRSNQTNPKKIHLGVIRIDPQTHFLDIVHATKLAGKVIAQSLSDVIEQPQYAHIVFVKRPTLLLQSLRNPQIQEELGFWKLRRSSNRLQKST